MRKRDQEAVAIFRVPGMDVEGRARRLKQEVGKFEGVLQIDINYITDTITIRFDPSRLTLDRLRREIGE